MRTALIILFVSLGIPHVLGEQPFARTAIQVQSKVQGPSLAPIADAATTDQIREYIQMSRDTEAYRARWIAAVDKNRSLGEPYWPESFWTAIKAKMQSTDLTPMYIEVFQHGVSRELMQDVLAAYERLGADHFQGSVECLRLGAAMNAIAADADRRRLDETLRVIESVYRSHQPEIKAARAQYLLNHPEWKGK